MAGRRITTHQTNPVNGAIHVIACDDPIGAGGAPIRYQVGGVDHSHTMAFPGPGISHTVTHEALLAVLIDRLTEFQKGPFKCHENGMALSSLTNAQSWLRQRTAQRTERGVEGTQTP